MTAYTPAIQESTLSENGSLDRSKATGEPLGQRTNSIRWLQKKVMEKAGELPKDFESRTDWESYRDGLRAELPGTIGIPKFPPLRDSLVRAHFQVGSSAVCERVDVYVDEDYAIPAFVFLPSQPTANADAGTGVESGVA